MYVCVHPFAVYTHIFSRDSELCLGTEGAVDVILVFLGGMWLHFISNDKVGVVATRNSGIKY